MDNFADKIHVHFWKLKFLQWSMKEITTPRWYLSTSILCHVKWNSLVANNKCTSQTIIHTYNSNKMSHYKMIFSILLVSIIVLRINSVKLKSFEFNDDDLNISLTFVEDDEQSMELIYDVNVTRCDKIWKNAILYT